jgi:hypothetical protein
MNVLWIAVADSASFFYLHVNNVYAITDGRHPTMVIDTRLVTWVPVVKFGDEDDIALFISMYNERDAQGKQYYVLSQEKKDIQVTFPLLDKKVLVESQEVSDTFELVEQPLNRQVMFHLII